MMKGKYPEGYTSKDDLNKDGRIDKLEAQLKVIDMKDNIANQLKGGIQVDYKKAEKKEVDFHHKVAYRFEKSYRLIKK